MNNFILLPFLLEVFPLFDTADFNTALSIYIPIIAAVTGCIITYAINNGFKIFKTIPVLLIVSIMCICTYMTFFYTQYSEVKLRYENKELNIIGTYHGKTDIKRRPFGEGRLICDNDDKYFGAFLEGKFFGYGVYKWESDTEKKEYKGNWVNGKMYSKNGVLEYVNSDVFIGIFIENEEIEGIYKKSSGLVIDYNRAVLKNESPYSYFTRKVQEADSFKLVIKEMPDIKKDNNNIIISENLTDGPEEPKKVDENDKVKYCLIVKEDSLVAYWTKNGEILSTIFRYKGERYDTLKHGKGILHFWNDTRTKMHIYKGFFEKDFFSGKGIIYFTNDILVGDFKLGKAEGNTWYFYGKDSIDIGKRIKGKREGEFDIILLNKSTTDQIDIKRYFYQNDKRGKLISKYRGEYENYLIKLKGIEEEIFKVCLKEGYGESVDYTNNEEYKGFWKGGQKNGYGYIIDRKTEKEKKHGKWENNVLIDEIRINKVKRLINKERSKKSFR